MNDFNAVLDAVKSYDLKRVIFLCETGADDPINEHDPDEIRSKLLITAAHVGSLRIATYLIERGADPRYADIDGETALHMAAIGGHVPIAILLIDRGADINARTLKEDESHQDGLTPLAWTVRLYLDDEETETSRERHLEMIKMLIEMGADINAQDALGQSPLHIVASELDNVKRLRYLMKVHAEGLQNVLDLDFGPGREENDLAPLRSAALQLASLLITKGAKLDIKDMQGITPLISAAKVNSYEIAALLVENGADIHIIDTSGRMAIDYARSHNNQALVKQLKAMHFPLNLLCRT